MSASLSLAEVEAQPSELVSRVQGQHERVAVTVHARPAAVLMAVKDLEALEETIAILADTDAVAALIAPEGELARGEFVTAAEMRAAVAASRRSAL